MDNDLLTIFHIQKYSLHDGRGIRTTVFLKGCPLRCRWCCNPESQSAVPEIMYRREKCIGCANCGFCMRAAGGHAIREGADGRADIDFRVINQYPQCVRECPSGALLLKGWRVSVDEILDEVERDAVFYRNGGGLTVSGGEPLMQQGTVALLREAKHRYIGTAMETCGYTDWERLRQAAEFLDEIFFDIKSLNDEKHREYTGVTNEKIRSNLVRLCESFPELPKCVRTPLIPGFNDREEELQKIENFLNSLPGVRWQKLPYHTYGVGKYEMLGRKYTLLPAPGGHDMEA